MASNKANKKRRVEIDPEVACSTLDDEIQDLEARPVVRAPISPAPKVLVAVVIDASRSTKMSGAYLLGVRAGEKFIAKMAVDPIMKYSVEVMVIAYDNGVTVLREFGPLKKGEIWKLEAPDTVGGGGTATGGAALHAFGAVEDRSEEVSDQGIEITAKLVIILTDGHATDVNTSYRAAIAKRIELEEQPNFRVFGVGIGDQVDMELLAQLTPEPVRLAGLDKFNQFWAWIYKVTRTASQVEPGDDIPIANPIVGHDNPDTEFAERWQRIQRDLP
jgi:uncharacterized protein YegL